MNKDTRVLFAISSKMKADAEELADLNDITLSEFIRIAITKEIRSQKKKLS